MNARLQKIADDLGTKTYKDPLHGQIAKDNFIYGVKQAELEETDHLREVEKKVIDKACKWIETTYVYTADALRKALEEE